MLHRGPAAPRRDNVTHHSPGFDATTETTPPAKELPGLWQLRVFETVARLESVTRASQELLRSQPATTSCIAAVEEPRWASKLFERSS